MKITFDEMGNLNVPRYCRKIMKEKTYPDTLEIYRGDMLCLTVDVPAAAKLNLDENTLRYSLFDETEMLRLKAWKQRGCAPVERFK